MGIKDKLINKAIDKVGGEKLDEAKETYEKVKKVGIIAGVIGQIISFLFPVIIILFLAAGVMTAFNYFKSLFERDSMTLQGYYVFYNNGIKFDKDALNEEIDLILDKLQVTGNPSKLGFKDLEQARQYFYDYFTAADTSFLPYYKGLQMSSAYVDGLVKIRRTNDATNMEDAEELEFKLYDDFMKMINEKNKEAMKCFTITPNFDLCIATYRKVTKNNLVTEYTIEAISIPYRKMVAPYTVSRDLLINLFATTENPEYVLAVANTIKQNGYIDFTIFDNKTTTTEKYAYLANRHVKKYVDRASIYLEGKVLQTSEYELTKENNMDTTITEVNTVTASVTAANSWITRQTTKYNCVEEIDYGEYGEEGREEQLNPFDQAEITEEVEGTWDTNRRQYNFYSLETRKWNKGTTNTNIEADEFLGLWANDYGKYVEGAPFKPEQNGGKQVQYEIPADGSMKAPINTLIASSDQWLYQFLETGNNVDSNQNVAELMKYMMKRYKEGIVDSSSGSGMDLSIFNPDEFIQNGTSSGSVRTTKYTLEEFVATVNNFAPPSGVNKDTGVSFVDGYNKYFKAYAEDFYNIAVKYNLNPEFIFSIGIHESYYGTSRIILNKNNAFGYGAVDGNAYNAAWKFDSMKEGIEQECNDLSSNFLNPDHWKYKNILAKGYNPETIDGIGSLYASDGSWARKVKYHMTEVFGYLEDSGESANTPGYEIPTNPKGTDIADRAVKKIGSRYVWGASGPDKFDCSGFVSWVYKTAGINIGRQTTITLHFIGKSVPMSQLQPGDILLRKGHTGIYIGNNRYVHAKGAKWGVVESINVSGFTSARRILDN